MKSAFPLLFALLSGIAAPAVSFADDAVAPPPAGLMYKGIGIDFGGFVALESLYRSSNMASDISTPYKSIPFQNSSGSGMSEFRETSRQSRLSILARGNVDSETQLAGYYEMDFLGAAPTANSNQSNSYNLRIRNIYMQADWSGGLHLLAGQNWSLATMNTKGITPRSEQLPATIDAQYPVGFNWLRQPQLRITKDWNKEFWAAMSFENPQTVGVSGALPAGYVNSYNITGNTGGLFNGSNSYSFASAPDFIEKLAWEASFGHLEVFNLTRNFQDRFGLGVSTTIPGTKQSMWTDAVGGGVMIPLFNKKLDVTASGLYGKGGARYGTSQLPDATYASDGSLKALLATHYLGQITWHATPLLDFYGTYGQEKVGAATGNIDSAYGYGDSAIASNTACTVLGASTATCSAQIRSVSQVNAGSWWSFYKGSFGLAKLGLQYSHTQLATFADSTGLAPKAKIDMAFVSLRYYPF